jgi:hypothetical protein
MAEDGEKRGFSGLSSLTSKVKKQAPTPATEATKSSEQQPPKTTATPPRGEQPSKSQQNSQTASSSEPSETGSRSSGWRWFLGIAGVVMVIAVYNSNQSSKRSSPSTSYTPSTSNPTTSYDRVPSPEPKPAKIPREPEFTFELPPIGQGRILSMAQIRWCLRENIRMDAKEPLIDTNSDVAVFNQSVNSYNSRCANYKYRKGNVERAKRQVEKIRPQIVEEAKKEFKPKIPQQSPQSVNPPSVDSAKEELAIETVREVQGLLKELGYKPGTIDGKYGKKTSDAIKEFQRDTNKSQNGLISEGLLTDLSAARDKASKNRDSLSKFLPQKNSEKISVEKSQFLVVSRDKQGNQKVIQSNRVPLNSEGVCYGWRVKLSGVSETVNLREILTLPRKPLAWPQVNDGSRTLTVSADGKSITTRRVLPLENGWAINLWCVAEGDPIGSYSIDVHINGKFIKKFNFEVFEASTKAKQAPKIIGTTRVPENATIHYSGRKWICDKGYNPKGGKCVKFAVPANATVHYSGRKWICDKGYNPKGGKCVKFAVPANATVHYSGRRWVCDKGFNPKGDKCLKFAVPANATVHYSGRRWVCDKGYNPKGGKCVKFAVPANATVHYSGRKWACNSGFNSAGDKCVKFAVPANATVHYSGRKWVCDKGFNPIGDKCVKFAVPANATVHYSGRKWVCDKGFNPIGDKCVKFAVPANAAVHYSGRKWVCNTGYQNIDGQCLASR